MDYKQLFNRAADIIERDGWFQLPTTGGHSEVCLAMSVSQAARELGFMGTAERWIYETGSKVYRQLGFNTSFEAIDWNDEPGRTKEEVIDRLRRNAV